MDNITCKVCGHPMFIKATGYSLKHFHADKQLTCTECDVRIQLPQLSDKKIEFLSKTGILQLMVGIHKFFRRPYTRSYNINAAMAESSYRYFDCY
jgi:DNA-directed RNA polymerase subunit RPC12/RpoP